MSVCKLASRVSDRPPNIMFFEEDPIFTSLSLFKVVELPKLQLDAKALKSIQAWPSLHLFPSFTYLYYCQVIEENQNLE